MKHLSLQTVFNRIAKHMANQAKRSWIQREYFDKCLYRGPNGLMCPAGIFLPDRVAAKYDSVKDGLHVNEAPWFRKHATVEQRDFLLECQNIHDQYSIHEWKNELAKIAKDYGLSTTYMSKLDWSKCNSFQNETV